MTVRKIITVYYKNRRQWHRTGRALCSRVSTPVTARRGKCTRRTDH